MDLLFSLSNLLVMPFWLAMIVLPRWRWTRRVAGSPLIVLGPALLYAVLIVPQLPALLPALARPELSGIAALLGTPEGATLAWAHFLAFDLFVGRWVYLDSQERQLPALAVSLILLCVLMVGPLGLLLYLVTRRARSVTRRARSGPEVVERSNRGRSTELGAEDRSERTVEVAR